MAEPAAASRQRQTLIEQWVLNASMLALAGLLVLGGRLADLLGRRRVFLLGSALFHTAYLSKLNSIIDARLR